MPLEESQKPAKVTSSRKIEANRRNAQRSTGPKTPEGKATTSLNATTHGIFVKQFLNGAAPETVAEIQVLAAAIREYYKPQGPLEEILAQKVVIETARYGRALGLEHPQSVPTPAYLLHILDRVSRYTTSTSRALYRAIQELKRVQAARKAGESAAASTSAVSALPMTETREEHPVSRVANTAVSESGTLEDPEGAVGKGVAV